MVNLSEFLKEYKSLEKPENKASLKKAYNWLYKGFEIEKKRYITSSYLLAQNLSQKIPFGEIYEDELEVMLDDFDYMIEQAVVLKEIASLLYDIKHHPNKYIAYKGEVEGEEVYLILAKEKEEPLDYFA